MRIQIDVGYFGFDHICIIYFAVFYLCICRVILPAFMLLCMYCAFIRMLYFVRKWRNKTDESINCFFFLFCTISVWISIQIPEGMDGPMLHETSARCRASRNVKQSRWLFANVPRMLGENILLTRFEYQRFNGTTKVDTINIVYILVIIRLHLHIPY